MKIFLENTGSNPKKRLVINKLIGLKASLALIEQGHDGGELLERRSGRSTAIAFSTISACMRNPGQWFQLQDHYGTGKADKYLQGTVRNIIEKLNFVGFSYKSMPTAIRFDLYEEYESKETWEKVENYEKF